VYEFLLVHNSNLGCISRRFGDIAGFLSCRFTPPLLNPNFGVFPLHQMTHVGVTPEHRP